MPPADTTHRACPVDDEPCWRERARNECPHRGGDGVRECVRRAVGDMEEQHADTWAALGKE